MTGATLCLKPIVVNHGSDLVRCGQCLRCRMLRVEAWVGRMVIEASCHKWTTVRTLTYAEHPGALVYKHIQDYFKRLRYSEGRFRFFAAGEHGDMFCRPHWHVVLFGAEPGPIRVRYHSEVWPHGYIFDDLVTVSALRYCCSYVMKNDKTDLPVMSRMSLRPGIGLNRLEVLGAQAASRPLPGWPREMVVQGHKYPLIDGGLVAFKRGFINAGGSPPVERSPIERKLAVLDLVTDWGTRIEQKRRWNTEWMLRRGELLAPSYAKKA